MPVLWTRSDIWMNVMPVADVQIEWRAAVLNANFNRMLPTCVSAWSGNRSARQPRLLSSLAYATLRDCNSLLTGCMCVRLSMFIQHEQSWNGPLFTWDSNFHDWQLVTWVSAKWAFLFLCWSKWEWGGVASAIAVELWDCGRVVFRLI